MVLDRSELERRGWTNVEGIQGNSDLLELARSIGRPRLAPTGELIKRLTPRPSVDSGMRTLSRSFGMGTFPLHTDTAFWPLPCRYLVFRATGDVRRRTTLMTFSRLLEGFGPLELALIQNSIWLARTPSRSFYCSMMFRSGQETVWRYDAQCMEPVNKAAGQINEVIKEKLTRGIKDYIDWTQHSVSVIHNWSVLHGREPMPDNEHCRLLERIYVE
jgi:hypothetical protein